MPFRPPCMRAGCRKQRQRCAWYASASEGAASKYLCRSVTVKSHYAAICARRLKAYSDDTPRNIVLPPKAQRLRCLYPSVAMKTPPPYAHAGWRSTAAPCLMCLCLPCPARLCGPSAASFSLAHPNLPASGTIFPSADAYCADFMAYA